jgi:ATP-dependent exoDNAse (exonuclease V) beta subunit
VIQDLLALTRALLHPADRIAWLAILRAPWCGLTLADLHALAAGDHNAALWDLIQNPVIIDLLSADGKCRLERVRNVLQTALAQRQRRTLRRWTEGAWLALGGPACVRAVTDLEDARVFFELLENMHTEGDPAAFMRIEERVEKLFALPDMEADESLQLMTIHKAKGLEFDIVIVPALGRRMPPDESRLLMWMERPALAREEGDLLLAPIKGNGQQDDPIYAYLKNMDQQKGVYEAGRLLYVAATRARKKLHLLGHATLSEKDGTVKKPQSGSLLSQLWGVVEKEFVTNTGVAQPMGEAAPAASFIPIPGLRRLKSGWRLPDAPASVTNPSVMPQPTPSNSAENIEFLWASDTARHVGTVVHRMLRKIAQQGTGFWNGELIAEQRPLYRALLMQLGIPARELDEAAQRVETALTRTLQDERGRWLLDHHHHDAQCEYALTGIVDGKPINVIIDRTFVDQQGVRWIIDYKTGGHEGTDTDTFLDNEQTRYHPQLQRYALLMSKLDDKHTIRLGLYFPLLGAWREWPHHAS